MRPVHVGTVTYKQEHKIYTFNAQEAEAEDHKLRASLSYRVSFCLKTYLKPTHMCVYTCIHIETSIYED